MINSFLDSLKKMTNSIEIIENIHEIIKTKDNKSSAIALCNVLCTIGEKDKELNEYVRYLTHFLIKTLEKKDKTNDE